MRTFAVSDVVSEDRLGHLLSSDGVSEDRWGH